MRILSFDTSTPNLYACLTDGENVAAERILICNPQDRQFAASLIMPTIVDLLANAGWNKRDLEIVVVGVGPGSFTGIRVATVTARTLCQALNLPLLGINRFQCYAFREQIRSFPTAMVLTAGKNQYFCAHLNSADFVAGSSWQNNTYHLSEHNLLDHLQSFENVYLEKSAAINPYGITSMPELDNPAITQALFAVNKIQSLPKPVELSQFSYKQIKPLYIQNASITVKPSSAVNQ